MSTVRGTIEGQLAFITGAGSGIGRAAAHLFAQRGASLALADIDEPAGRDVLAEVSALGAPAFFERCDVSRSEEVRRTLEHALERFGQLHHAFNNAGIGGPSAEVNHYPEDEWDRVIAVNLTGVWLCMKYEIDHMISAGGGTIVNTSSIAGTVAYRGGGAYIAAKHGVIGITKTAAIEYASSGVRINAICPGYVATPMALGHGDQMTPSAMLEEFVGRHPIGRLGEPPEIAEVVVWLSLDAPEFLTGHAVVVDGGYTAQ